MVGGTPSKVCMMGDTQGTPDQVWMVGGTLGTPNQDWMGYPPTRSGWWGYPPTRTGWVTPSPIRQSSKATTCYVAGGVPLAFTQEDFLVLFLRLLL